MLHRAFWTERRFTGLLLMLGCLLYWVAVGLIPRDAEGHFSVTLPPRAALLVIAEQTTLLQWSMSLFLSGIVLTALGFALLTRLLWDSGERTFSLLALIASLLGVVLLVIYLAFLVGVWPFAGQETARTGVVPDYYLPEQDVQMERLQASETTTRCPYKGQASYWSARVGESVFKDIVWSYREPLPACSPIAGLLCFLNERVDAIYLDDQLLPTPIIPWS